MKMCDCGIPEELVRQKAQEFLDNPEAYREAGRIAAMHADMHQAAIDALLSEPGVRLGALSSDV